MRRIALVLLCLASFPAGSPGQSLTQVGVIDVRGPKGQRFDYLTMDDEDHYLLSAPLGRLATAAKRMAAPMLSRFGKSTSSIPTGKR